VSGVDALPTASPAITLPADVRKAGKEAEQTYRAALSFERSLVEQLTKTLSSDMAGGEAADAADGEDSGASAATSAYRDMLPGTLADAVTGADGLGLAHDLFLAMRSAS
jgi:Rod binding domain-containing protein